AIRNGKAELVILNVENGDVVREIPFPEVGEILNPSWSPDGRSIAFSATVGGASYLFVHDLEAGTTRRLTSDVYADLQPAWSPDGRTIAFVTDRFTTNLKTLEYKAYHLATIDVATREVRELPAVTPIGKLAAKHIAPQWSGDGGSLFFL